MELWDLVVAIDPTATKPTTWGDHGPEYHAADISNGHVVLAKAGKFYVVSVVVNDIVRSILVSAQPTSIDLELARSLAVRSGHPMGSASSQSDSPASRIAQTRGDFFKSSSRQPHNDPNAPPGFEDEHQILNPSAPAPYRPEFSGDADVNPPGGRRPRLEPFVDPLGDPANRSGPRDPLGRMSGMTPTPFGTSQPPVIRRDPPFPGVLSEDEVGFGGPFGPRYGPGARRGDGPGGVPEDFSGPTFGSSGNGPSGGFGGGGGFI